MSSWKIAYTFMRLQSKADPRNRDEHKDYMLALFWSVQSAVSMNEDWMKVVCAETRSVQFYTY